MKIYKAKQAMYRNVSQRKEGRKKRSELKGWRKRKERKNTSNLLSFAIQHCAAPPLARLLARNES